MYKLYWHPSSSSYAPMAVLEETGVEFELHKVDYHGGETQQPAYRRLQPLGLIPALAFGEERSMFESGAIVLYLCDRHRERIDLAPRLEEADRPGFLQWLFFLAGTLYPAYNRYYWSSRYASRAEHAESVKEQAGRAILKQWQTVEDSLAENGPWLAGKRFSACDIYLQMVSSWHEDPAELLNAFPRVKEVVAGVLERPACRRAFDRHGFQTGLAGSSKNPAPWQ